MIDPQTGITLDHSRDELLSEFGVTTLLRQYCLPGETPQGAFARAARAFCGGDDALAQRLYDYASRQWFMFATPLLSNGGTNRGLPISCFLNHVHDSVQGLVDNFSENALLSTNGGGIGTYWGDVRSIGQVTSKGVDTPGVMAFMHVQDAQAIAYHQGSTRRGAHATYLDVSHPEIVEFINMRSPTGGDAHRKNENLHHGVNVTDDFMRAVEAGGQWDLVDPHSGRTTRTMAARDLWVQMLQQRARLGEPYLFFIDAANRGLNPAQHAAGLRVRHSNLCTEITLATTPERTAVCCLSSLNVATLDAWWPEREQLVADLVTMLDNALEVFCDRAPPGMWRAVASVRAERSIGLGTLGFHTYCQLRGWPLGSAEAASFNGVLYAELKAMATVASRDLAAARGEPSDLVGTGMRNAHLLAIAPNATSSIICGGVSPSTEPMVANAFSQKTMAGTGVMKNPALVRRLRELGRDTDDTWRSVFLERGSVQHLPFLSAEDKDLFRTASETDPDVLVDLAAQRQPHICQAQSLNLFLPADVDTRVLHRVHMRAWKQGLKSLYYLRSSSVRATSVGVMPENAREPAPATAVDDQAAPAASCSIDGGECRSCEG
jgi:ribonucleoside-diphosphate reductase alpha chain